jgi:sensor histidine kinase YesM
MKKFIKEHWKTAIWLVLAGYAMALMYAAPWARSWEAYIRVGSFTACTWLLMWIGNNYTSHLVSERISWTEQPAKRFIVGMLVMVVYTVSSLLCLVLFYEYILGMRFMGDIAELMWTSLSVTFVISLFMHGRGFLRSWRTAELNAAQLQKESMKSQFDSLKSQVNPHFLFNSLNALTNLIYEDQDKAARFVKQLSEVYRYVLDTQGKEVVKLADELKFLKSYMFLQAIRFGDKLKVDIKLDDIDAQVAPLVLQMLLENAIKHNIISSDQPLTIRIFSDKDQIIVENNIQIKNVIPEESKGIGLENIKHRYGFLTGKKVEIINDSRSFIVKLPFL